MADVKISALPAATNVLPADIAPIVSGGITVKATLSQIAGAVETDLGLGTMSTQNANDVAITAGSVDISTLNIASSTLIRDPLLETDELVIWNSDSDTNQKVTMKQILEFVVANFPT